MAVSSCARFLSPLLLAASLCASSAQVSILGDPGMTSPLPAVGLEAWNFCNYAQAPAGYPTSPSPEWADCATDCTGPGACTNAVADADNALSPGDGFPGGSGFPNVTDVNMYAILKQQYLGQLCQRNASSGGNATWSFWKVMFKSGNMNTALGICNATSINQTATAVQGGALRARRRLAGVGRIGDSSRFNNLPMNQPLVVHGWSNASWPLPYNATGVVGYFSGTYDVSPNASSNATYLAALQQALHDFTRAWYNYRLAEIANASSSISAAASSLALAPPTPPALLANSSFLTALWYRNVTSNSFVYYNVMRTSATYPWLMNYLRTDGVRGGSGGAPWDGRGVLLQPASNPGRVMVNVRLRVLQPGASSNQFYLPEISGCWKPDGSACDGVAYDDITRYLCFIVNPSVKALCSPTSQGACPPWHVLSNGTRVSRNDTQRFPHECYHMYCAPPGSADSGTCDPYSNPVPQELVQILPCAEWAANGFPSSPGDAWVGDDRLWALDVAGLSSRVFTYGVQPPAGRSWVSFEIGPEQLDGSGAETVRWEVADWDVTVHA